jgi:hypothetical protein
MGNDYNPNSVDAMFARLFQRMDQQDKMLAAIDEKTTKINGRVYSLEREKWKQRGFIAAGVLLIGIVWQLFLFIK